MLLTLDLGNTFIKSAVFKELTLIETYTFKKNNIFESISLIITKNIQITDIIISSVLYFDIDSLKSSFLNINFHYINHQTKFPFANLYSTPNTIGIDRLVVAAGATYTFPKTNRLIIDAGTCVTYDFVNDKDEYLGGAISPGLSLRYQSLHNFTEKLPLLSPTAPKHFIGNSTPNCIHTGINIGLALEIDGFIELYKQKYNNLTVILTGGDSDFLAKQLKNIIFANRNFLNESLAIIFKKNITDDKKNNI